MSLFLTIAPAFEPITLSDLKLQCGFGPMEDTDQLREQTVAEQLRPAIVAARQDCEAICARAFITQTWTLTLDHFPRSTGEYGGSNQHDIPIPLPTFQALNAFAYVDGAGVLQDNTVAGAWGFQIVSGGDTKMARLRPPVNRGWPLTYYDTADAVSISFVCGFGDTPAQMPFAVRQAVKINAQWLYQGASGARPPVVEALLSPYIVTF